MSNPMTPAEQDTIEKYRSLIMKKHSDEWDMEKVSTVAHICPTTEPIAKKIARCENFDCTTCPDNAIEIAQLIAADRKRVALEARAKVITDIELFVAQEASTYMNSKYTVHQHQKDYSDGIADGKNNAYSRLAQWLNRLKAQQEEV